MAVVVRNATPFDVSLPVGHILNPHILFPGECMRSRHGLAQGMGDQPMYRGDYVVRFQRVGKKLYLSGTSKQVHRTGRGRSPCLPERPGGDLPLHAGPLLQEEHRGQVQWPPPERVGE